MEAGTPGFNEGVRRLAQYRPFEEGGRGLQAALQSLVLSAAELNDGSFTSLRDCQAAFQALWGLEVEIEEIRAVKEQLVAAGLADAGGAGIVLTSTAHQGLEARAAESESTEATALLQWEREVRELRPSLTSDEIDCLRSDLSEWLGKIVARHGAEAALILYPEDPRAHQLFEQIEEFGTGFLPKRGNGLTKVRDEALKRFVRQPSAEQRAFLANRLNTAFYLTVLTLDPAARILMEEKAKGTRIYIDTNVLYAVLGMAPADEVTAAHRLLELSRDLGYQLAVTRWTVTELQESIERARKNVEVHGTTFNPGIARLMVHATGEKGATRTFWQRFLASGITKKDFFERVSAFEEELPRFGIDVVDEGCATVDSRGEELAEYSSLLERVLSPDRPRHRAVVEHDAKHRLLVERLRGSGTGRFSTTKAWFLTQDTKLPTFARLMPDADDEPPKLPFCISPSAWAQIVRAMTPRTEDWDQMVVDLLASPYVGYQGPLDQQAVREVVARIDSYEDASPELALAVVQDTAMMRRIGGADPEDVEQHVRRSYSSKAEELQKQAAESANVAAEEKAARGAAERREHQARDDLEAEIRRREAADRDRDQEERRRNEAEQEFERRLAKMRDEFANETEQVRTKHAELERRMANEDERRAAERVRRRRRREVILSIALGLLTTTIATLLIVLGVVRGAAPIVAVVVAGALLLALAINRALPAPWGSTVVNWTWGLTGVAGIALTILLDK